MYLSKLTLNPGHAQARRDLADPYEMHRTLTRAFVTDNQSAPERFLWRLEKTRHHQLSNVVLIQAEQSANWKILQEQAGYAEEIQGNKAVDLDRMIQKDEPYRFRLLANPTVSRNGKRYGLVKEKEQIAWLKRQGQQYGFLILAAERAATERINILQGKKSQRIILDSVLLEGVLEVTDANKIQIGIKNGLGHGKAFGLGLLSLARIATKT